MCRLAAIAAASLVLALAAGCTGQNEGFFDNPDGLDVDGFSDPRSDAGVAVGNDATVPVPAKPGLKIGPPPRGLYLGMAEREPGQVYAYEHAIGRKAPFFWPKPIMRFSQEGVLDAETSLDPTAAQAGWDAGYALMAGFEPHPENGMRVDAVLRGEHDVHLERLAGQIEAAGRPMFFSAAREPNGVLTMHKGGYGPDGDKDLAWALQNGRFSDAFDPSGLPRPELYAGLGDPQVDDGLERLAALQRYLHDFFVKRRGIKTLSFETMGWAAMPANDETPVIGPDFIALYQMIADSSEWISLNWYSMGDGTEAGDGQPADVEAALGWLGAYVQAIRDAGIDKPIMLTEFGLCATPDKRAALVKRVLEALVSDLPEIKAVSIWNIPGCDLDDQLGYPEIKQVIDAQPDLFHSCLYYEDGSPVAGCDPAPSDVLPQGGGGGGSCIEQCLASGETRQECEAACNAAGQGGDDD